MYYLENPVDPFSCDNNSFCGIFTMIMLMIVKTNRYSIFSVYSLTKGEQLNLKLSFFKVAFEP